MSIKISRNRITIEECNVIRFLKYMHRAWNDIRHIRVQYPDFTKWLITKVVPGMLQGTRKVYVATVNGENNIVVGIMIVKNDVIDKKICTLWVHPNYERRDIGYTLVCKGLDFCEGGAYISVPRFMLKTFQGLIVRFDFYLKRIKLHDRSNDSDEFELSLSHPNHADTFLEYARFQKYRRYMGEELPTIYLADIKDTLEFKESNYEQ